MRRLAVGLLLLPSVVSGAGPDKVVAVTKEQIAWQATPGMAGGPMTAIEWGDPAAGAYEALFKFAAGYQLPAHFHQFDEVVTVVSGSVLVGGGDSVDEAKGVAVGPGGSFTIPGEDRALGEGAGGNRDSPVLARASRDDRAQGRGEGAWKCVDHRRAGEGRGVGERNRAWFRELQTSLQYGDPKTGPYLILLKLPGRSRQSSSLAWRGRSGDGAVRHDDHR